MDPTTIFLIVETTVVIVALLWWRRENVRNAWLDITYVLWYKPWHKFQDWKHARKQAKIRRENDYLVEIIKSEACEPPPIVRFPDEVYQAYDLLSAMDAVHNTPAKLTLVREAQKRLEALINRLPEQIKR